MYVVSLPINHNIHTIQLIGWRAVMVYYKILNKSTCTLYIRGTLFQMDFMTSAAANMRTSSRARYMENNLFKNTY